jgi:lysozyme
MVPCIDISHFNGKVDFHKVFASGRRFVFGKASENVGDDPTFAHNRNAALDAGLLFGGYHFFRFDDNWGPQATHFVKSIGTLRKGELPPVLDLEQQVYRDGKTGISVAQGAQRALAWLDTVHGALGALPIVYCDPDFAQHFLQDKGFAKYPLWLAGYQSHVPHCPAPWKSILFWQNAEHGLCPGVSGDCDLDWYMGTLPSLQGLAKR